MTASWLVWGTMPHMPATTFSAGSRSRAKHVGVRLLVAVALVLAGASVGWYVSSHQGQSGRFESCRFDGEYLVLSYTYGANEAVSLDVDKRAHEVVVTFTTRSDGGIAPMVLLDGEARFRVSGGPRPVRHSSGERLDCPAP